MRYKHSTGDVVEAFQLPLPGLPASKDLIDFLQTGGDDIQAGQDEGIVLKVIGHDGREGRQMVPPGAWVVRKPNGDFVGIGPDEFKRDFKIWEN